MSIEDFSKNYCNISVNKLHDNYFYSFEKVENYYKCQDTYAILMKFIVPEN